MAETDYRFIQAVARCSCGACQISVAGRPLRVSVCHCQACQRRTGSAIGVQARFALADLTPQGEFKRYIRQAESGNQVLFYFCPECGATLYYQFQDQPEFASIPVGAFADPNFPLPRYSVYHEHQYPWLQLAASIATE